MKITYGRSYYTSAYLGPKSRTRLADNPGVALA